MSKWNLIQNASTGQTVLARAKWCLNFWDRFRGLMFRRSLPEDEGLLFVFHATGTATTSIHMFFVVFPIAAVWLDEDRRVVGKVLAKPWRPYYASSKPARYLIEARPSLLDRVNIGDVLTFDTPIEQK
jgi:uncharacterized protein